MFMVYLKDIHGVTMGPPVYGPSQVKELVRGCWGPVGLTKAY